MSTKTKKYYECYEDRYRRVYAQGVDYWTGNPDEISSVIKYLEEFLVYAGVNPSFDEIVEFGCGEGFLGEHLLSRGYSYLGIDLSLSVLEKARNRVRIGMSSFIHGDITDLVEVKSGSFSAGLDNYCLHMLVIDEDRKKYLSEIHRVLKKGGHAWFHEIGQEERFNEPIASLEDFLAVHPVDLNVCEPREAYTPEGLKLVHLPRLPARFNNCDGYRDEITNAGFSIDLIEKRKSGIVIHAEKIERSAGQTYAADAEEPRR